MQNTGHGDLVELHDGSWALVLLGTRPRSTTRAWAPMGRETFVTPVTWVDGWPHAEPVRLDERHAEVSFAVSLTGDVPAAVDGFDPEILAVRRFPREVADPAARPGALRLTGRGVGMDDSRPDFLGIRQVSEGASIDLALETGADGVGGLAMRYDEQTHLDIEVRADEVAATMHIPSLEQTWSVPRPAGDAPVRLRLEARPPVPGVLDMIASCDELIASVHDGGDWVEIARIDGRYLSSDFCESFTGRIVGPLRPPRNGGRGGVDLPRPRRRARHPLRPARSGDAGRRAGRRRAGRCRSGRRGQASLCAAPCSARVDGVEELLDLLAREAGEAGEAADGDLLPIARSSGSANRVPSMSCSSFSAPPRISAISSGVLERWPRDGLVTGDSTSALPRRSRLEAPTSTR